ncbi:MAG: Mrp/NBP35 family ATP-binding protein [Lachnospiraceae bacterium]
MSQECNSDCGNCGENCSHQETGKKDFRQAPNDLSHIHKVIAVVSGKGGVGKSLVTSLLSVMMRREGYRTAILDADITGPSIPKAFGIKEKAYADELGMHPVKSLSGISVMSVNLLLDHDTDPVVWRGPIIAGTVTQFWTDVIWEDVDYMFVDMPPGTGDVPLTVFQSLPVDGVIIVASPQELVGMIVEKAVNMAAMMDIPVLALVENMSYYKCPDCGSIHSIFGESRIEETAARHGIDTVCKIPVDPALAALTDAGQIEAMTDNSLLELISMLRNI